MRNNFVFVGFCFSSRHWQGNRSSSSHNSLCRVLFAGRIDPEDGGFATATGAELAVIVDKRKEEVVIYLHQNETLLFLSSRVIINATCSSR